LRQTVATTIGRTGDVTAIALLPLKHQRSPSDHQGAAPITPTALLLALLVPHQFIEAIRDMART
jgi:hypothetical protein